MVRLVYYLYMFLFWSLIMDYLKKLTTHIILQYLNYSLHVLRTIKSKLTKYDR